MSGSASSSALTSGNWPGTVELVDHRPQVEAGAADEQRPVTPSLDVGDRRPGPVGEGGDGEVLPRVDQVDEVVGHLGPLGGRRLGGADVHAAVHLHGVDRHDLDRRVRPGHRQRQRRLARRGGAHHGGRTPGWTAQRSEAVGDGLLHTGTGRGR